MNTQQQSIIVVGAGIVGLSVARAFAIKGFSVKVFDRSLQAEGASVRNFGMVWPIGQPAGELYKRAMRTRNIWKYIAEETNLWYRQTGSLHLAYTQEELTVLQELEQIFKTEGRDVQLKQPVKIISENEHINPQNLLGGLYSSEELLIDPREAMHILPQYLQEKYEVEFYWNKCVSYISEQTIYIGNEETHEADIIVICSGIDFETLYPEEFTKLPITKCKLQMMRTAPITDTLALKIPVCGGLSLLHYKSFAAAPSLPLLKEKMENDMKAYLDVGIHVMASQNELGEVTIGDSHEYGLNVDPFDKSYINKMIIDYLKTFLQIDENSIAQTWHGFYPKLTNGDTEIFFSPEQSVYILNGLGGAGMTLALGLGEEIQEYIVKIRS
jgi:FAD dependent oxidoreductase TIGR03364